MTKPISMSLLVKVRSQLQDVLRMQIGKPITLELWSRVNEVHAQLHAAIEPQLFDHKVEVAIERGPQIAESMGAQLPGARA